MRKSLTAMTTAALVLTGLFVSAAGAEEQPGNDSVVVAVLDTGIAEHPPVSPSILISAGALPRQESAVQAEQYCPGMTSSPIRGSQPTAMAGTPIPVTAAMVSNLARQPNVRTAAPR